jgi:hypothetical protein
MALQQGGVKGPSPLGAELMEAARRCTSDQRCHRSAFEEARPRRQALQFRMPDHSGAAKQ